MDPASSTFLLFMRITGGELWCWEGGFCAGPFKACLNQQTVELLMGDFLTPHGNLFPLWRSSEIGAPNIPENIVGNPQEGRAKFGNPNPAYLCFQKTLCLTASDPNPSGGV